MSRHFRFSALRRLSGLSKPDSEFAYRLRRFLYAWMLILLVLFALTIVSLSIFIYLVPCPVWYGGRVPVISSITNHSNSSYHNNSASDLTTASTIIESSRAAVPAFAGFSYDFYTWKCPSHALYYVQEMTTTTPTTENMTVTDVPAR